MDNPTPDTPPAGAPPPPPAGAPAGAPGGAPQIPPSPKLKSPLGVKKIEALVDAFNAAFKAVLGDAWAQLPPEQQAIVWTPPEGTGPRWTEPLPPAIYAPIFLLNQAIQQAGGPDAAKYDVECENIVDDAGLLYTTAQLKHIAKDKKFLKALHAEKPAGGEGPPAPPEGQEQNLMGAM